MNAPYTGGFAPGNPQFAVDGNFYSCDPCSPPKITFPFKGDTVFTSNDVLYLTPDLTQYYPRPLGDPPNIQPWSPVQTAFVIEQEFMVAMEAYIPLALNTPYYVGWSIGWQAFISTGYGIPFLQEAFLVEEGDPEDMGQGIIKIRRRFATLPAVRNETEQFTYTFPGLTAPFTRLSYTKTVVSRLQYDYYVFDDYGLLTYTQFPFGPKLDAGTGLYPVGLILQAQNYYANVAGAVFTNNFLDFGSGGGLTDAAGSDPGTIPQCTAWVEAYSGTSTSNGQPAEIVAESSTLRRWLGNIYERRTRFVLSQ